MIILPQRRAGIVHDWFWKPSEGIFVRHDDFEFAAWQRGCAGWGPAWMLYIDSILCLAVCPLSGVSAVSIYQYEV